jgi:UDP-N-acetyl-D-galactosamine dehydrogenase
MVMDFKIGVIGLGYVGLPTAIAFQNSGFSVVGIDINSDIVNALKEQKSHLSDMSSELKIPEQGSNWKLYSNYDQSLKDCDIILITVPTPVNEDKTPDLSLVESAMRSVINAVEARGDNILVLESTVYPGATMSIFNKIREEMAGNFPKELRIAYSPERVSPGDSGKGIENIAKIVGSNDRETGLLLSEIYGKITQEGCKYVGSIEVAEAAKMIENTQRDIDLAFVNELSQTLPLMGLDVMEVINAASTKWNFHRHTPGIGVGGHCIPIDPYYYIQSSKEAGGQSDLSPAARAINESMPGRVAEKILSELTGYPTVLILGLAYKPGVGDLRESPVIQLVEHLNTGGVTCRVWDPLVHEVASIPKHIKMIDDPYMGSQEVDMVVLATGHPQCLSLDWGRIFNLVRGKKIYDGPRMLSRSEIESFGFTYLGVGVPDEEKN